MKKFGPQTAWPTGAPMSSEHGLSTALLTNGFSTSSEKLQSPWTSEASQTSGSTTMTSTLTSFDTSYTRSPLQSSSKTSVTKPSISQSPTGTSQRRAHSSSIDPTESPTIPTSSSMPDSNEVLSKNQKIGLGVGIPLGLLTTAALIFACCALCRRHKKKNVEGSIPPASPGFIPRFAFQERYSENLEHRTPLNRSVHDAGMAWDDEGVDVIETTSSKNPYAYGPYNQANSITQASAPSAYTAFENNSAGNDSSLPSMAMQDSKPIMTPALFHTHTSNRARGKRTSYTSLHSVAEVSEPDEMESPILGRHTSPDYSPTRNLTSTLAIPVDARIKRKPVPSSPPLLPLPTNPSPVAINPGTEMVSHKLMRQTMPEHSGSSSSGLALTTSTGFSSDSSLAVHAETPGPASPISNRVSSNPFHYDSYVEDYGPEYQNGYVDVEDGLYGGNTSLSQYSEPRRKNSKTEWPLRNMVGSHHRRRSSPIWERIYEE